MNIPFMDLPAQYRGIKKEMDAALAGVIDRAEFIGGPTMEKFEKEFAAATWSRFAVGVSSGTSALFLSMKALGLKPGDEVITVPNTFIATSETVTEAGGRVKFVDVDPETFTMDPALMEAAVTKRTFGVIPVHLHGQMADMTRISSIARKKGLKIVEDAAQAHLSLHDGKPAGSFSSACCYSFYPGKNLGAYGDAGAVTTPDRGIAESVTRLRNHGRLTKYTHLVEAYNHRLDTLQAAVLSVKLRHLERWTEMRRKIAVRYREGLKDIVLTPVEKKGNRHVYHLFVIRVETSVRDRLADFLKKKGVATGVHYPVPLHLQPAYRYLGLKKGSFPVAERLSGEILSLPIYPELTEAQIERVIASVRAFFGPSRGR